MAPATFFWGDNRADDPVPGNFLKLINSGFKESSSDTFKAKQLENGLATNSVAELWFDTLDAATKADWDRLEIAFKARWPKEVIVPPTVEQRRSRLRAEKLAKEDIGVIVMANGVEMSGQARWASKILALSALAEDPTGASIHSVRDGMPDIMKKLVKGTFATWAEFCTAVKAVSDDEINTAVAEEKRISAVEDESKRLRTQLQAQQSPTAPLRSAFGNFNMNRSHAPVAPPLSEAQFFQSGTMGANNIMNRFQPARSTIPAPASPPMPAQRAPAYRANHLRHADLSANTKNMVHYPDTPEGQIAYQAQLLAWKTANPQKYKGGDEYAPYPLTPGTLSVGVGECHSCGMRHPMGTPHPRPNVDAFETNYRRIAGHIIRTSRNAPPVAPKPANVQYVGANPEYLAYLSRYDEEQGNGDGPVV